MDVALVVHRVDGLVEPGRRRVVIDERVEQAALVVQARADHRAEDVQVADTAAVDLHVHAERLGEVDAPSPAAVIPPTSPTPPRTMSQAPALIHSARAYILPSAVSGPQIGSEVCSQSQT